MAIKAGQILHLMNQFIVDRIQTANANLNIPEEKVYELGNGRSVAIVRDTPDLTFSLDNLSVDTEVEALLTGSADPTSDPAGTKYDLNENTTVDVVSPFKSSQTKFDVVAGVAVPHLTLESVSYRYGLRQNATEQFSLRGDAVYYSPGNPYVQTEVGDGTVKAYPFSSDDATPAPMTALKYTQGGDTRYALNVSVDGVRKLHTVHYTETASGITFIDAPAEDAVIRIVYASQGRVQNYTGSGDQYGNAGLGVKAAAVRSRDIQIYLNGNHWTGIQAVNLDWRATLDDDYEFGNANIVARDYAEAPAVSGSLEIKPVDPAELLARLRELTGVGSANDVIGPDSSVPVTLEIVVTNPGSGGTTAVPVGTPLKTLYVPDARFTIPGYEGRANSKITQTLNWQSDTGTLSVVKAARW